MGLDFRIEQRAQMGPPDRQASCLGPLGIFLCGLPTPPVRRSRSAARPAVHRSSPWTPTVTGQRRRQTSSTIRRHASMCRWAVESDACPARSCTSFGDPPTAPDLPGGVGDEPATVAPSNGEQVYDRRPGRATPCPDPEPRENSWPRPLQTVRPQAIWIPSNQMEARDGEHSRAAAEDA